MDTNASTDEKSSLSMFHPVVQHWLMHAFPFVTEIQQQSWPVIAVGESALLVAPTGTGKTLAAFLWCIQRLMFSPVPDEKRRCRVLYVSPLKALAVDVQQNLQFPLQGIAALAEKQGVSFHMPTVGTRTGDTSVRERALLQRRPPDILVTTPESLYLLLSSSGREMLRSVETIIIDEIHALVPTKRGTHLALSVERLETLCGRPLQRIGLSATQRPLEEVARFLGGLVLTDVGASFRPVTIVAAAAQKQIDLQLEMLPEDEPQVEIAQTGEKQKPSFWSTVCPTVLAWIRTHRTTLLFVNSRRVAEKLAGGINDLAQETLVLAHHGSLALPQRREVEQKLKSGQLRALVATSSLELGIDMGSIDLVVQIESPPSIASGIQRIGRANHHVGGVSKGFLIPKHRLDVIGCVAAAAAIRAGEIESIRYPLNCLDVLAQHVLSMVSMEAWQVDDLYRVVCQAAPFAKLTMSSFLGVLNMLSGGYPSDEFADLRARIQWDRSQQRLTARLGTKRVVVTNPGTIPDRGLYPAFWHRLDGKVRAVRVGELDEEMVHESQVGDVFVLGASTWKIENISHDRVLVSPAPGQIGKMPFWKGDSVGRPLEFGKKMGALVRTVRDQLAQSSPPTWFETLPVEQPVVDAMHRLIADQIETTGDVPSDQTIIIERYRDPQGDFRVCLLTPLGAPVLLPWCASVGALLRRQCGYNVETLCTDDGFVVRFPNTDHPPDIDVFFPNPEEAESLLLEHLGRTSLFAARFRENAGRALLLPKRRPGQRAPLWQQRKRAADLLQVASKYQDFPIIIESYRECLRDVFDVPAWLGLLEQIHRREIQVRVVDTFKPSPFATAVLFTYVGNFLYDQDVPLAEKRTQTLAVDPAQLLNLFGEIDLRSVLDPDVLGRCIAQWQHTDPLYHAKNAEQLQDILRKVGDLSFLALCQRCPSEELALAWIAALTSTQRVLRIECQGEERYISVEDATLYRDALGVSLPPGVSTTLDLLPIQPDADPLVRLVRRYSKTQGPFVAAELTQRWGVTASQADRAVQQLLLQGELVEGKYLWEHKSTAYCEVGALEKIRHLGLARARRQIQPVSAEEFSLFLSKWNSIEPDFMSQTVQQPIRAAGDDSGPLLDAVASLQAYPVDFASLEEHLLPARWRHFQPAHLDALLQTGDIVWQGVEKKSHQRGRIALFLAQDSQSKGLLSAPTLTDFSFSSAPTQAETLYRRLLERGASFFQDLLTDEDKAAFPLFAAALWDLVWCGAVSSDSLAALRAYRLGPLAEASSQIVRTGRRLHKASVPPSLRGRWFVLQSAPLSDTARGLAWSQLLLERYGVVAPEMATAERIPGGFSSIYPVLKQMELAGQVRRGLFVQSCGATQFALPFAVERLRSHSTIAQPSNALVTLSAVDPIQPYGNILPWPAAPEGIQFARVSNALVLFLHGKMLAYVRRNSDTLAVWLSPPDQTDAPDEASALATGLANLARTTRGQYAGTLHFLAGVPALQHPLAPLLQQQGYQRRGQTLTWQPASAAYIANHPTQPAHYDRFQTIPLDQENNDT